MLARFGVVLSVNYFQNLNENRIENLLQNPMTQSTVSLSSSDSITTSWKARVLLDGQTGSHFAKLPTDLIFMIIAKAGLPAVSALALTCKGFAAIRNDAFWRNLFTRVFHRPCQAPQGMGLEAFKREHLLCSNIDKGVYVSIVLPGQEHASCSRAVAGGRLITGSYDQRIKFWDLATGDCVKVLEGHEHFTTATACTEELLFSGSADNAIKVWSLEDEECLVTLEGHTDQIDAIVCSGEMLFSSAADNTVRIWDLMTNACKRVLLVAEVSVMILDGKRLFTISKDDAVRIWDIETGICTGVLSCLKGRHDALLCVGNTLFVGCHDKIQIWDLETSSCTRILEGHSEAVISLAFAHGRLFSGSADQTIKCWNLEEGTCLTTLKGHNNEVCLLAFDEERLISCSRDNETRIWNFEAVPIEIFAQLMELLKREDPRVVAGALKRFSAMPRKEREKIYQELYRVLNPNTRESGSAEEDFHNLEDHFSTRWQKICALQNYLAGLSTPIEPQEKRRKTEDASDQ